MRKLLKWTLFSLPFVILSLLIVLTFFQLPASDDFVGSYFVKKLGLGGAIQSFLANGTGRYFSITLYMLATSCRSLMDHYYFIVLIFFIILTYINVYFFIKWTIGNFFNIQLSAYHRHWATAFLLLVFFTAVPEISTFLYWVTTGIVYLLSFNIFLCYLRSLFSLLSAATPKAKKWQTIKLAVWVIILAGSVEIALFFSVMAASLAMLYYVRVQKKIPGYLLLIIVIQLLLGAIVLLMPGNQVQTGSFSGKQSVIFSLAGAFYQTAGMFLSIFSGTLFWIAFIICLFSFSFLKPSVQRIILARRMSFLFELGLLFSAVLFFHFFIRHWGGRVIPDRAENLIACFTVIGFFWVGIANGHLFVTTAGLLREQYNKVINPGIAVLLLLLLFNPFVSGLLQTLVTAPVHRVVQQQRLVKIMEAKSENRTTVVLKPYREHFEDVLQAKYTPKIASFIKVEFRPPPKFLFFVDGAVSKWSGHTYGEYYGIDTIICGNSVMVRWELSGRGLWDPVN